jgi:NADH:ubiquinone oxidoreductase subunit 4 (subunit M)
VTTARNSGMSAPFLASAGGGHAVRPYAAVGLGENGFVTEIAVFVGIVVVVCVAFLAIVTLVRHGIPIRWLARRVFYPRMWALGVLISAAGLLLEAATVLSSSMPMLLLVGPIVVLVGLLVMARSQRQSTGSSR